MVKQTKNNSKIEISHDFSNLPSLKGNELIKELILLLNYLKEKIEEEKENLPNYIKEILVVDELYNSKNKVIYHFIIFFRKSKY